VVTVRRRRKEDAKRRFAEQLDAYADRVGWSVLLELVSTEIDPGKKKKIAFRDSSTTTTPAAARCFLLPPSRRLGIPWRVALHL